MTHLDPAVVRTRCAGRCYAIQPMRRMSLLDAGGAVRLGVVQHHGTDDVQRVLTALDAVA